ncbi:MAG TPA: hypothetical protein VGV37_20665 [Aliidongia sp.]|uniref:hypothetical protein n=1 Tax=Aliidongia sp. TaxID=1914230 RepID=UPI002DDD88DE|nr:hypothetical protein [Aliidongia sp.]HEV2676953.1 hypothetical protein [Aliidongia sp.]
MASFTLQAFKAGVAPRSVEFADEQTAYAETMRLQRSGTVDSLKLVRIKDQKVLFDTTKGVEAGLPPLRAKRSKLVPLLVILALVLGIGIAFALALLKRH